MYGELFGVDEWIVDILLERINEINVDKYEDLMVLLVGRGSSDFVVKKDFNEIV